MLFILAFIIPNWTEDRVLKLKEDLIELKDDFDNATATQKQTLLIELGRQLFSFHKNKSNFTPEHWSKKGSRTQARNFSKSKQKMQPQKQTEGRAFFSAIAWYLFRVHHQNDS